MPEKPELRGIDRGPDYDDTWSRKMCAKWGQPALPCDCGYFVDQHVVTCSPEMRSYCRENVNKRLQQHHRSKREREVRSRRQFPGYPFPKAPWGTCVWCGDKIFKPDGAPDLRRRWHKGRGDEAACLHDFYLHTRREDQLDHLVERDGPGCRRCGKIVGGWTRPLGDAELGLSPDALRARSVVWRDRLHPRVYVGNFNWANWRSGLEVDHEIALYLVSDLEDDLRRPFFGPGNLQALCSDCHERKTSWDMKLIKEERVRRMKEKMPCG